jgi:hypothetical protein
VENRGNRGNRQNRGLREGEKERSIVYNKKIVREN